MTFTCRSGSEKLKKVYEKLGNENNCCHYYVKTLGQQERGRESRACPFFLILSGYKCKYKNESPHTSTQYVAPQFHLSILGIHFQFALRYCPLSRYLPTVSFSRRTKIIHFFPWFHVIQKLNLPQIFKRIALLILVDFNSLFIKYLFSSQAIPHHTSQDHCKPLSLSNLGVLCLSIFCTTNIIN